MEECFNNKTVAITGGLGDIGKGIAQAFAKNGANIAICDILDFEIAKPFIEELQSRYRIETSYAKVDVTSNEEVNFWINKVNNDFGKLDVLIANAAKIIQKNILEIDAEQWKNQMDINLNAVFYSCQAAAKTMIKNNSIGHIIIMGSWAAHKVHLHLPDYSVAKAALRMLCKCLSLELAKYKILVNEIAPGFVEAGLSAHIWNEKPHLRNTALCQVPTNELIQVDDIAQQILNICHPNNKHITGTTILMDGGLSLL